MTPPRWPSPGGRVLLLAAVALALYVAGVAGRAPESDVLVAFGDSLTEGSAGSGEPWPALLEARLRARGSARPIRVVNAGIAGNRLLRDGYGPRGLRRFARDALGVPGVRWVVVLIGINDLGFPGSVEPEAPPVSATDLIDGYRALLARARSSGVALLGGTLLPFEDPASRGYYTAEKEQVRQGVNAWIRSGGELDGVIDFEAAVRDPRRPARLLPAFDAGDGLHLTAAGQRALADAVDLSRFDRGPSAPAAGP